MLRKTTVCLLVAFISFTAFSGDKKGAFENERIIEKCINNELDIASVINCRKGENLASVFCRYDKVFNRKYPDLDIPLYLTPEAANITFKKDCLLFEERFPLSPLALISRLCDMFPLKFRYTEKNIYLSLRQRGVHTLEEEKALSDEYINRFKVSQLPEGVLSLEIDYDHCMAEVDDKVFTDVNAIVDYLKKMKEDRYKNGIDVPENDKRLLSINKKHQDFITRLRKFAEEHKIAFVSSPCLSVYRPKHHKPMLVVRVEPFCLISIDGKSFSKTDQLLKYLKSINKERYAKGIYVPFSDSDVESGSEENILYDEIMKFAKLHKIQFYYSRDGRNQKSIFKVFPGENGKS